MPSILRLKKKKTPKKADKLPVAFGTAADLAKMLEITVRRVQQLRAEGVFITEETKDGPRYNITASLAAYCRRLLDKRDEASEKLRAAVADADYKENKSALLDIELRKRRGEIHEAAHVRELMNGMILTTKAAFLSLPSKIAHDLAACDSEAAIAQTLRAALCEVMEDMGRQQYNPAEFQRLIEEEGGWLDTLEVPESAPDENDH